MTDSVNSEEQPLSKKEFEQCAEISAAEMERLDCFVSLLCEWQQRMNLVSTSSLKDLWRRHMLDSVQLKKFIRDTDKTSLDFGSGAGFPGMVLGILTSGPQHDPVHLVESHGRKCSFLHEVARKTEANVVIHNARIENLEPFPVDVITARAVAPLEKLLTYSTPFMAKNSRCLFLKGLKSEQELTESRKKWNMIVTEAESLSDASGVILTIERISRHHV